MFTEQVQASLLVLVALVVRAMEQRHVSHHKCMVQSKMQLRLTSVAAAGSRSVFKVEGACMHVGAARPVGMLAKGLLCGECLQLRPPALLYDNGCGSLHATSLHVPTGTVT